MIPLFSYLKIILLFYMFKNIANHLFWGNDSQLFHVYWGNDTCPVFLIYWLILLGVFWVNCSDTCPIWVFQPWLLLFCNYEVMSQMTDFCTMFSGSDLKKKCPMFLEVVTPPITGVFIWWQLYPKSFNVKFLYRGPSWLYGSWVSNYLCSQCLSSLTLWVLIPLRWGVLDTSIWDKVCQWLAAGRWFSPGIPISSTNKTDRHNITEILLKVELNTINLKNLKPSMSGTDSVRTCFLHQQNWVTI